MALDAKVFEDAALVDSDTVPSVDASIDAAVLPPDATCGVMWPYEPSNFDECQLPAISPFPLDGIRTLDTDMTPLGITIPQPNGLPDARLIHVQELQMPSGAELTVIGSRGLILAVEAGVQIDGSIIVTAGARSCNAAAGGGTIGLGYGGGGGGGGGGATGGSRGGHGGGVANFNGGQAGAAIAGGALVVPFRGGCRGGGGGDVLGGGGGSAGMSGGALQISAKATIQVSSSGRLLAHGRGGGRGDDKGGGGGGGAGGALLLEAPDVRLDSDARVCADGGSGGQGGSSAAGSPGVDGPCNGSTVATTGSINGAGGAGGSGGGKAGTPGQAGNAGSDHGGGGGGGAAGFIRLRGTGSPATIDPAAIVTPTPNTN